MAFDLSTAKAITITQRQGGGFDISTAKPVEEEDPVQGGLRRAALQGATFGAGDELTAALTAGAYKTGEALGLLPESGQSVGDIYSEQMQREQERLEQFREQSPGQAFAAEMAGGLLTGAAGAGRLFGSQALSGLSPVAKTALAGGIEGAVYGGLSGKPGERLESAGIGGLAGAVGAPIVSGVSNVAANLAAPVARRVRNAIVGGPASDAQQYLAAGLGREGIESLGKITPTGRGAEMATLADLSQAGRGMLEGLVSDPDSREIRRLAKETLTARNQYQQSRLFDLVDEDLGTVGRTFRETIDALKQSRAKKAAPLYREAGRKPLEMTPYMKAVMHPDRGVPEVTDALRQAQRQVATRRATGDEITNIDVIDEMKRVLDDDIKALYRQGKNNRARDLVVVKNKILQDVDNQIPEYKAARNVYAGDSELLEAAELGTRILKSDVDYLDDMLRTMSQSEKGMFRVGAKKAIREKMMQARQGTNAINRISSEINLDRMKRAFPDESSFNRFKDDLDFESRIFETERVLYNSMTALRQAEQKALNRGVPFESTGEIPTKFSELVSTGLNRIFNRKLSPEARLELGKILLTPIQQLDPNITLRIERTIEQSIPQGQRTLYRQMVQGAKEAAQASAITAPAIAPSVAQE